MEMDATAIIEQRLKRHTEWFFTHVVNHCKTTEQATYALCASTHDMLHMFWRVLNKNLPTQEAKAAFKVALDTAILSQGMSVQIHEFDS